MCDAECELGGKKRPQHAKLGPGDVKPGSAEPGTSIGAAIVASEAVDMRCLLYTSDAADE